MPRARTISRTPPTPILRSTMTGQPATRAASPRCATFSPRATTSPAMMPCAPRKPPAPLALPLRPARSALPSHRRASGSCRLSAPTPAATPKSANAAPTAKTAAVPDTAGMTGAFAVATPSPAARATTSFHGLFQDTDRTAPVAAVVSHSGPRRTPRWTAMRGGTAVAPRRHGNLFSDPGEGA